MTVTTERRARPRDQLTSLCGEAARIFRRTWGRGPIKTTAHWAGPDILVLLHENAPTDAEKALRDAGHTGHLLGGRELLQQLVEDDLRAAAERIVGRPVATTLSATRLDPDLSAEIFLFARASETPVEEQEDRGLARRAKTAVTRSTELEDELAALSAQDAQATRRSASRPHQ